METDVVVVGAGPNGLAAAVTFARAGLSVKVYEAEPTAGGGARTGIFEWGDDAFSVDTCSAVHPLAAASPFFIEFDLATRGVEMVYPEISYAHPLDHGPAGLAYRSLEMTAEGLGVDGKAWASLLAPFTDQIGQLTELALSDRGGIGNSKLIWPRVRRLVWPHPVGVPVSFAGTC